METAAGTATAEETNEFVGDLAPPKAPRRRKRRLLALVVVVAVVGAGVGYASTTELWPGNKKTWDPAIEPLARFVENTRGGRFEEPIEVVFNSRADYSDHFAIDRDEVDEDEKAELAHDLGILRALGFISGDLDLLETAETLGQSGTIGFFNPDDGRIHVKGDRQDRLDATMRKLLVHELTHAYDFTHFDLDVEEEDFANSGEEFGFRSIVEGSAQLVEEEYVASLTDKEREEIDAAEAEEGEGEDIAALKEVPRIFLEAMVLPYVLGPRFLLALGASEAGKPVASATEARKGIDRALRKWPRSEEQVAYLDEYVGGDPPRKVATPKLGKGEEETDEPDDFGQLSLALLLAPHVGSEAAWRAVQGWAGDASATYRVGKDGPPCVRVAVGFDGASFAGEFQSAAQAWAATIPGAVVTNDSDTVRLQACDPGASGPPVTELVGPSVTSVVAARADLVAVLVAQGVPEDAAECVGDDALARLGVTRFLELDAQLVDDPGNEAAQQEVGEVFQAAALRCGLGG